MGKMDFFASGHIRGIGGRKKSFFENCIFRPFNVKISKKFIKCLQKFSQFYVRYQNSVQFDHTI